MSPKPPLGLLPEWLWIETRGAGQRNAERIHAIIKAMNRYADADAPIPLEWATELHRRLCIANHQSSLANERT